MTQVSARGIAFTFDPDCGFIRGLTITDLGQTITPLHRVPWAGEVLDPATPPHLRDMEGDFFCAPFAQDDGDAGFHGWPANGQWRVLDTGPLHARLDHPVRGAVVAKHLTLIDDHPFVYQKHSFTGGAGSVPVANHAMVSMADGGLIRWSAKAWVETCPAPPEADPTRGRSALAYPARGTDARAFPRADGGVADLTRFPFSPGHEEFVVGLALPDQPFGWTAVTRPATGDLFLSLRDARALPMTMLWHSDAGRDYAPWNGRHRGCLGVEEGIAPHMLGIGAPDGMAPGLALGGVADVRHVIGAVAWPSGQAVASVTPGTGQLTITGAGGAVRTVPFDDLFLA